MKKMWKYNQTPIWSLQPRGRRPSSSFPCYCFYPDPSLSSAAQSLSTVLLIAPLPVCDQCSQHKPDNIYIIPNLDQA